MDKKHYPTAFLLVVAVALYFMYGDYFSLKSVNLEAYKKVCFEYQSAEKGTYTENEILGLVSQINYLLPEPMSEIKDPLKKDIKTCSSELSKGLNN